MVDGMTNYLKEKGFASVSELVGMANSKITDAGSVNRSTIEYPKFDRSKCVSCGRCYLSCFDGGHQALRIENATKKPILNPEKCVGCQLCKLVCPAGAISAGARVKK